MELRFAAVEDVWREQVADMLRMGDGICRELLANLQSEPGTMEAVLEGGELAGVIQLAPGERASFALVFVAPGFRRRRIGAAAIAHGEQTLLMAGARQIRTEYRQDDEAARRFARRFGYKRRFASALMTRVGGVFPVENWPIRPYQGADYDQAHDLYARAFHEMRVRVGDFPDSVIEPPSEKSRNAWVEDAPNRFSYVLDDEVVGHGHIEGDEISSVSVRPDLQGRGIGRALVMCMCNEIYNRGHSGVSLWCVVGNRARHLYERLGFQQQHVFEFAGKCADE